MPIEPKVTPAPSILDQVADRLFDRGWLLVAGVVLPAVVAAAYGYAFWRDGCCDTGRWGEFGDFFGGTLNPLLTYFTLVALVITLREQRRLAIEVRQRSLVDELQRAVSAAVASLETHLSLPYGTRQTSPQGDSVHDVRDFIRMFSAGGKALDRTYRWSRDTPQYVRSNPTVYRAALRWMSLSHLLRLYASQGGSPTIVRLYAEAFAVEGAFFHALWPGFVKLEEFDALLIPEVRTEAEALAHNVAESEK